MKDLREYAQKWGHEASQVQPPLTDKEHITIVLTTLSPTYYDFDWLSWCLLANPVQTKERIEDRLQPSKLKDYQALFEQATSNNGGASKRAFPNKKIESSKNEVHTF